MMNSTGPYTLLATLGISFRREPNYSLSPEECFISLIEDHNIIEDRRLLSLAILVFEHMQENLRPDLFRWLAERMSPRGRSVLGGIIFREHLRERGRWGGLLNYIRQNRLTEEIYISSERLMNVRGQDAYFMLFNIGITPVASSDDKKLLNQQWIEGNNPWIVTRLLFGPTTRADIATIRREHYESTPNRVAERFNCKAPSITKIWNQNIKAQTYGLEVNYIYKNQSIHSKTNSSLSLAN